MKRYFTSLAASFFLAVGVLTFTVAPTTSAVDVFSQACNATADSKGAICNDAKQQGATGFNAIIKNVINTILMVLGMIAVIMIIAGGIRYTTSNGDSNQTKAAKDTILYSVVGLVIAILAFAIVNFVLEAFK